MFEKGNWGERRVLGNDNGPSGLVSVIYTKTKMANDVYA